eukprot:scaffold97755_cov61-Attheya_sp.AAC.2
MATPFRHTSPHMIARCWEVLIIFRIKPGSKVLYIGAAAGTSVSHVSHVLDIVGSTGIVYMVEFSAQPNQARSVALNSHYFLKNGGHAVIVVKASCIDSTAAPEAVFRKEVSKLQAENFKPLEQLTLEPYERDHAIVIAQYRPIKKKKQAE